jgi:hypothetical protein
MTDRTIKSKSPWFRLFTLAKTKPLDDLAKAQAETAEQIRNLHKQGKSIKRRILK